MITPTIGRMVYYKALGSADGKYPSKDRAAVITDVQSNEAATEGKELEGYQVRLCVFNPEGLYFTPWLDQGDKPGQWDWMPFQKDQAARMAPGTLNESHPGAITGGVVNNG